MKKLAAMVLLVLVTMSLALPSHAESFTFPNGARWNMSQEEIVALEEKEPDDRYDISQHVTVASYSNQIVSKYTAEREYLFANDCLFLVVYENFSSVTAADMKYLKGALTYLYGESSAVSDEVIEAFLADITVNGPFGVSDGVQWSVGDDTTIWLFFCGDRCDLMIFYIMNSFDPSQICIYDVTGL